MNEEMNGKFSEVDKIKNEFEKDKQRLMQMRKLLVNVQPGLAKEMTFHSMRHDTKKN